MRLAFRRVLAVGRNINRHERSPDTAATRETSNIAPARVSIGGCQGVNSGLSLSRRPPDSGSPHAVRRCFSMECSGTRETAAVEFSVHDGLTERSFLQGEIPCPSTFRGRFTTDAVKGMMAKPENREEAVSNLFNSVGGKLIAWYLTFGPHDWLVIGEFPDDKSAASAVLAAAAGVVCPTSRPPSRCQPRMQRPPSKLPERRRRGSGAQDGRRV